MAFKVLGVNGSKREGSKGAVALEIVLAACRLRGAETKLLDLRALELPMFRPDRPADSGAAREVTAHAAWADALVLSSPDYHGSMSGAMKNFLDYNWEEFAGKLFGHLCTSHEKGLTVMEHMRTVVRQCYGWSLPYGVSFHGESDFDERGVLHNTEVVQRLEMLARDLVVYGPVIRSQFLRDLAGDDPDTFAAAYRR
ncbi:MAG TPA: NAD(P)H-dependent oxidoreductase [Candidatus Acidoferrales bacterium]|nr:NAD(P)H-dependent oxidoreductase [Candidatus Acidoferrales bacterium]